MCCGKVAAALYPGRPPGKRALTSTVTGVDPHIPLRSANCPGPQAPVWSDFELNPLWLGERPR